MTPKAWQGRRLPAGMLDYQGVTALMHQDRLSGTVPAGVTRPLHPHEVTAQTNFAQLNQDVDTVAAAILLTMKADRAAFIALLESDLQGLDGVEAAQQIQRLSTTQGVAAVSGMAALIARSQTQYRSHLNKALVTGESRIYDEARGQGVTETITAPGDLLNDAQYDNKYETDKRLDLMADRLATAPHADVLQAAADEAYRLPGLSTGQLISNVIDPLRELSADILLNTLARPAAHQATCLGRLGALVDLPEAQSYYASEILDKSTCDRCDSIDGYEYASLVDAKSDYPSGGYTHCLGGDRCRGTIVAVWGEAANN